MVCEQTRDTYVATTEVFVWKANYNFTARTHASPALVYCVLARNLQILIKCCRYAVLINCISLNSFMIWCSVVWLQCHQFSIHLFLFFKTERRKKKRKKLWLNLLHTFSPKKYGCIFYPTILVSSFLCLWVASTCAVWQVCY